MLSKASVPIPNCQQRAFVLPLLLIFQEAMNFQIMIWNPEMGSLDRMDALPRITAMRFFYPACCLICIRTQPSCGGYTVRKAGMAATRMGCASEERERGGQIAAPLFDMREASMQPARLHFAFSIH
jgi:hypothetical protein